MNFIVVFGGVSYEHEISIVSAIALKKELANIAHFVFIDAQNDLYLIPRESMTSKHFSTYAYKKDAQVSFTKGGFLRKGLFKSEILSGIVINLIHGKSGEDGQIAGLLDFHNIAYIGPRIEACAVSFSKELTKSYAKARGVKVLNYKVLNSSAINSSLGASCGDLADFGHCADSSLALHPKSAKNSTTSTANTRILDSSTDSSLRDSVQSTESWQSKQNQEANSSIFDEKSGFCETSNEDKTNSLSRKRVEAIPDLSQKDAEFVKDEFATFPCIIKPAHLGSSIGISVAKERDDLPYALDCAFEYDSSVVIEPFIPHIREFNLAGCKVGDEFIFSIIEEVKKDEFFAFEDKYLDFQGGEKKKSANLSDEIATKIQKNFKAIYNDCFEGALIRCDFFMLENEIYLNEINPIPGSLAYYLFDDFNGAIRALAQKLPKERKIPIKYNYISKIQAQKGK